MNQVQTSQNERSQLLQSLLKLDRPLDQILPPLNQLGWDSDEELATLHPQHLYSKRQGIAFIDKGDKGEGKIPLQKL